MMPGPEAAESADCAQSNRRQGAFCGRGRAFTPDLGRAQEYAAAPPNQGAMRVDRVGERRGAGGDRSQFLCEGGGGTPAIRFQGQRADRRSDV